MAEKDTDKEIERVFVVPLRKAKSPSSRAAPTAIKHVRVFLTRHMKVKDEDIWIDDSLNNALWAHGKYSIPSKIRVRAVKFEDGVVEASLPELGFKKSRREFLKEEREKKTPILRREEEEGEAEAPGEVSGAEDYEVAPTADGDVKIKKKKAPHKKKEEKPAVESKRKPKKTEREKKKEKKAAKSEKAKKTAKAKGEKPESAKKRKKLKVRSKETSTAEKKTAAVTKKKR